MVSARKAPDLMYASDARTICTASDAYSASQVAMSRAKP